MDKTLFRYNENNKFPNISLIFLHILYPFPSIISLIKERYFIAGAFVDEKICQHVQIFALQSIYIIFKSQIKSVIL